jgi:hypothetical protein
MRKLTSFPILSFILSTNLIKAVKKCNPLTSLEASVAEKSRENNKKNPLPWRERGYPQ